MTANLPIVRHFIACERIERLPEGNEFTLHRILHSISPSHEAGYPWVDAGLHLFVLMSDCRGQVALTLEMLALHWEREELLYTSPELTLNLGDDPLYVHTVPIRLYEIPFDHPGFYEFRLKCGQEVIARESILLRETQ